MAIIDYTNYLDAHMRIFPLHAILPDGSCACCNEECKAIGKHPKSDNWQKTEQYDDAQLAYLEDFEGLFLGNQLLDNFGVLVDGYIIVDVDGRNGGFESAAKLQHIREQCAFIVRTGSGNGEHWYFKLPQGFDGKLAQTLREYPGIDFKSSGFVVGAYSLHHSGLRYEAIMGDPSAISCAPGALIELLKRDKKETFAVDGVRVELSELKKVVMAIPNNAKDYEKWIRIGMALHNATSGDADGYALWLEWSAQCAAHDESDMFKKWKSFGSSDEPVTEGTLITWAKDNGYVPSVTFVDDTGWGFVEIEATTKTNFNLSEPPGLVGEITKWINSRCAFPREKLAVAAALQAVGNIAGLHYIVDVTHTTLNLITLGIAGSRTGKGAIKKCMDELHNAVGLSPATHGKFKSSQELIRNAIHHQCVHYIYDEFGKQMEKLAGAGRGGAHYLEDLMAELIAMYSEADGFHGISGDMKRELAEMIDKDIAREVKKLKLDDDENPRDYAEQNPDCRLAKLYKMRETSERGLDKPFLTFFGLTEPHSFNAAVEKDAWFLNGGFMGRALLFEELENVPLKKPYDKVSFASLPQGILYQVGALANGGSAAINNDNRIERSGDWQQIRWSDDALSFLRQVEMYWREVAIGEQDNGSNMESQANGATELMIKVAGILSVDTQIITRQNAEWAHELVKSITIDKISRAKSNANASSNDSAEKGGALLDGIMRYMQSLPAGGYATIGRLRQSVGRTKYTNDNVTDGVVYLQGQGRLRAETVMSGNNKQTLHVRLK